MLVNHNSLNTNFRGFCTWVDQFIKCFVHVGAKTSYETSIDNKIVQSKTIWFLLISLIVTTTNTVDFKVLISI